MNEYQEHTAEDLLKHITNAMGCLPSNSKQKEEIFNIAIKKAKENQQQHIVDTLNFIKKMFNY